MAKKFLKKIGTKPGSVIYVGRDRIEPVEIDVIDYTDTEHDVKSNVTVEKTAEYKESPTISWINVDGIHDPSIITEIGQKFNIHDLVLEDIVNTGQRPKIEEFDDYIFVALKMFLGFDDNNEIKTEHVSLLFGNGWVITFQETGDDVFEPVRKRIEKTIPRNRFITSGYLAYTLIDAIVDHYFVIIENIGEQIELLDDKVSDNQTPDLLNSIKKLKHQLIFMRKITWPLREVVSGLERIETDLIKDYTRPYIRDLYEHVIQVIDNIETYRELVSSLLDLYHTGISNRMNEIMKVLTIFAAIFIPLGFLAGVYGMNFDTSAGTYNLPELGFKYGYIFFWCLVISIGGGLLWFFRRKKWL